MMSQKAAETIVAGPLNSPRIKMEVNENNPSHAIRTNNNSMVTANGQEEASDDDNDALYSDLEEEDMKLPAASTIKRENASDYSNNQSSCASFSGAGSTKTSRWGPRIRKISRTYDTRSSSSSNHMMDRATANSTVVASFANQQQQQHPEIEIQQENSAWDALGQRFQEAADEGRYIDLSDTNAAALPAQAAASDFAAVAPPVNPSSIVQPATYSTTTASMQPSTSTTPLGPLWDLISETVAQLKVTRELLVEAANRRPASYYNHGNLSSKVRRINSCVENIGVFVSNHEDLVLKSDAARSNIEELNLLVHKANIFVNQVNNRRKQQQAEKKSRRKNAHQKRKEKKKRQKTAASVVGTPKKDDTQL